MVGRLISFWEGLSSGDKLVLGRASHIKKGDVRTHAISGRYAGSYVFEVSFNLSSKLVKPFLLRCIWFLLCYNLCAHHFHCRQYVSMCQLPSFSSSWLVKG